MCIRDRHPIITKGGDLVNIVPADVRIETYVRGMDTDAVVAASAKVNRALEAGAYAVGARCEIKEPVSYTHLGAPTTEERTSGEQ